MEWQQEETLSTDGGKERALIEHARRQAELAGSWDGGQPAFGAGPPARVSRLRTELPPPGYFPGYEVVRILASGGEGVVYEAIQKRTKGKVAIKALVSGLQASPRARKRFEREIELIVQLKHPHIVTLFEAGTTIDGLPFYVMDYIKGVTLDEYVRRKELSLEGTIHLFATVSRAVQHFHQKGVIHRDLKPSNILVDSRGVPRIVDFGLAKLLTGPVDLTISGTQAIKGTLPYMSPEQAGGRLDEIDTRSDIYSLGVILYELLTGGFPYPMTGSRTDVLIRICHAPPTPPRQAWRSSAGATPPSTPWHHTGRCPFGKDVEMIILGALEKDPDLRYQSAQAFADDLEHYLKNEPIARHTSRTYRIRKFVRRHRAAALGAAAVALSLLIGAGTSTVYAVRESRARSVAEVEASKAHAALAFLRTMLTSAQPELGGRDVRVLDILDEATHQLEYGHVGDPVVEAMARLAIGSTYLQFDRHDDAHVHLERAKQLFQRVYGSSHPDIAESLYYLAWLATREGRFSDSKALYRQCLSMREALFGENDERVARTLRKLGALYRHTGSLSEAEDTLHRALRICRHLGPNADAALAEVLSELALLDNQRADFARAQPYAREALTLYRASYGPSHATVATAMTRLATALRGLGDLQEAEYLCRAAYGIRKELYGPESAVAAETLVELSYVLRDRSSFAEAEQALKDALRILRAVYDAPSLCTINTELALAKLLDTAGKPEEAVTLFPKIIDAYARMFGSNESFYVANARSVYGECLRKLRRYPLAEQELRAAYEVFTTGDVAHGKARLAASRLAVLYDDWGNTSEAERWRSIEQSHR